MILHILERALIHIFCATGLVVGVFFILQSLQRRFRKGWLSDNTGGNLLLAGLIVFSISTMREAYDVYNGQPLIKAFTDYTSWLVGVSLGEWASYRLIWLKW